MEKVQNLEILIAKNQTRKIYQGVNMHTFRFKVSRSTNKGLSKRGNHIKKIVGKNFSVNYQMAIKVG